MGKDLRGKELGSGLRQKQDGRYLARFSSKSGRRPEKLFDKLPKARLWLEEQKYLDSHGSIASSGQMTLNTWYEYWIENIKKPSVTPSTYREGVK